MSQYNRVNNSYNYNKKRGYVNPHGNRYNKMQPKSNPSLQQKEEKEKETIYRPITSHNRQRCKAATNYRAESSYNRQRGRGRECIAKQNNKNNYNRRTKNRNINTNRNKKNVRTLQYNNYFDATGKTNKLHSLQKHMKNKPNQPFPPSRPPPPQPPTRTRPPIHHTPTAQMRRFLNSKKGTENENEHLLFDSEREKIKIERSELNKRKQEFESEKTKINTEKEKYRSKCEEICTEKEKYRNKYEELMRKIYLVTWEVKIDNGEWKMYDDSVITETIDRLAINKSLLFKEYLITRYSNTSGVEQNIDTNICRDIRRKEVEREKMKRIEVERQKNKLYTQKTAIESENRRLKNQLSELTKKHDQVEIGLTLKLKQLETEQVKIIKENDIRRKEVERGKMKRNKLYRQKIAIESENRRWKNQLYTQKITIESENRRWKNQTKKHDEVEIGLTLKLKQLETEQLKIIKENDTVKNQYQLSETKCRTVKLKNQTLKKELFKLKNERDLLTKEKSEIITEKKILEKQNDEFECKIKISSKESEQYRLKAEEIKKSLGVMVWQVKESNGDWKSFDDATNKKIEALAINESLSYKCNGKTHTIRRDANDLGRDIIHNGWYVRNGKQELRKIKISYELVNAEIDKEKQEFEMEKLKIINEKELFRKKAEEEEKQKLEKEQECEKLKKNLFVVRWQWRENNGEWKLYTDDINKRIESLEMTQSLTFAAKNNQKYKVTRNSKNGGLQNNINTGIMREIRRIEQQKTAHIEYPNWWNIEELNQDNSESLSAVPQLVEMDLNESKSTEVAHSFYTTLGHQKKKRKIEIIKIEAVQNQRLYHKYWNERNIFKKSIGEDKVNEKYLWHGTKKQETMQEIVKQGFRKEFNETAAWGKGTYFAVKSGYSVAYAAPSKTYGVYQLFQCGVICGESIVGQSSYDLKSWPKKSNGLIYDSLVSDKQNIYVIHDDVRAIPMFVITFKMDIDI